MSINKTRSILYWLAKFLGDVQAVRNNRVGKRIGWRLSGKLTSRILGKIFN